MVGPVGNALGFAELSFGEFGGFRSVTRVDFDAALADFILTTVVAKHLFQELDNEAGHEFANLTGWLEARPARQRGRSKGPTARDDLKLHASSDVPGYVMKAILRNRNTYLRSDPM
jgi:hypothetical protein